MVYQTRFELSEALYRETISALVVAIAGPDKAAHGLYSPPAKDAAWDLVQGVNGQDDWRASSHVDSAIGTLVAALVGENVGRGPYCDLVYDAVLSFVYAYRAGQEIQNCRITDRQEYDAERERLRKIGETIDPATAETMFWFADMSDPYDILDYSYHEDCVGRVQAARNPGEVWVVLDDLPAATAMALWERDRRKLVFPHGIDHEYEIINKPPVTESVSTTNEAQAM
jgi:hypothetical protein